MADLAAGSFEAAKMAALPVTGKSPFSLNDEIANGIMQCAPTKTGALSLRAASMLQHFLRTKVRNFWRLNYTYGQKQISIYALFTS